MKKILLDTKGGGGTGVGRRTGGDDHPVTHIDIAAHLGAIDGVAVHGVLLILVQRMDRVHAPGQGQLMVGLILRGGGDDGLSRAVSSAMTGIG